MTLYTMNYLYLVSIYYIPNIPESHFSNLQDGEIYPKIILDTISLDSIQKNLSINSRDAPFFGHERLKNKGRLVGVHQKKGSRLNPLYMASTLENKFGQIRIAVIGS